MKKQIALAGVVVAAAVAWLAFSGDDAPTGAQADLPDGALVAVKVPELTGLAVTGKRIFDAKCAACHGENAAGRDGAGPPFVHQIYRPAHHGDAAFLLAPQQGVRSHHWPFGDMPPVQGISPGEIKMVIEYVRQLQRANGIN